MTYSAPIDDLPDGQCVQLAVGDAQGRPAGPHPGGDTAEDRGTADARKKRRLTRQRVRAVDLFIRPDV
jgi:hypothetical protein